MSRLILVSNRLPITVSRSGGVMRVKQSTGGLASALRGRERGEDDVWVGWPGPTHGLSKADRATLDRRLTELNAHPVEMTEHEARLFYEGVSNGLLWPTFHYVLGVLPLSVEGWPEYRAINERFADAVADLYRDGDDIWIHDYHLLLLPQMLRNRLPDAKIGFFLHIPFPSSEMFATLPHREELLRGMLGADLIGFHTTSYCRHFAGTVSRILRLESEGDVIRCGDRSTRVAAFPLGIDTSAFEVASEGNEARIAPLREGATRILLGVDRLDYTKGIPRRLLAVEALLHRHAEWRGKVRLIQVAVPSREAVTAYQRLRREVDRLVGRINGSLGTAQWMPIHYLYRSVPFDDLLAMYRAADAMLVTPVRDGMNLVAKEFVASRTDEDGVLVLSEFAGAAENLDAAVLVNPYDVEATADAIHEALTMPASERKSRMKELRARVRSQDVHQWSARFMTALHAAHQHAFDAGSTR
jgi:trehalose 6-phosphate synthase/phosphatase